MDPPTNKSILKWHRYFIEIGCICDQRKGHSGRPSVSEQVGGEIFRTCPDRPWGPPNLLYNGYWVFPGDKERPCRDADPSPPSSAVGHERVGLYLYSPYGPYGLCRASVPLQGCTLPFTSWNVMAHGDAQVGKWRGNWRVSSTLHTTSERAVSSITTADAHTSASNSRLNWRPCRLKWTSPFRRKRNLVSARVLSHFTQFTNSRQAITVSP